MEANGVKSSALLLRNGASSQNGRTLLALAIAIHVCTPKPPTSSSTAAQHFSTTGTKRERRAIHSKQFCVDRKKTCCQISRPLFLLVVLALFTCPDGFAATFKVTQQCRGGRKGSGVESTTLNRSLVCLQRRHSVGCNITVVANFTKHTTIFKHRTGAHPGTTERE